MKKLLFSIAAAAAMLVSCSEKEITVPETGSGEPFSFHASILADKAQDTKTTLTIEGTAEEPQYKVAWDEGDQLSVVAVYADESRQAYQFTKGDGDIFSCESVENPGDIKALNVFYPYDKNQYDMDGEFGRAGMSFGMNAVQNGTDDAAHIDGPLYGYAQVADGQASVAMAHASTLFDIQVVNEGASDISVSEISLTAGEQTWLMGWFQINPRNGELKLTNAKYYISELTVTDGTVKAGQTGHFYITTTPFGMTAGSELTVTVTASGEDYIVKKNMERDVTFAAGKVNHVTNIAVSPVASVSVIPEYMAPSFVSGSFDISVEADGAWTATQTEGSESWLHLSETSGDSDATVSVTLDALTGDSNVQTAYVTFSTADREAVMTIQHGYAQEVNGHIWAKANVGEPDMFASSPDDPGLLYQYGSKVGWNRENPEQAPDEMPLGDKSGPAVWAEENDPCPTGWRVPTRGEVESLVGASHESVTFGWVETSQSGFLVNGAVLGLENSVAKTATKDNMNGGIFLPCSGNRHKEHGKYQNGDMATMTTATRTNANNWDSYKLTITSDTEYVLPGDKWGWDGTNAALPVRCIADTK